MRKQVHLEEEIEIQAPVEEVFAILADPEKHLQLGPAWGQSKLEQVTDDYPQMGGSYVLQPVEAEEPARRTLVTDLDPSRRIAFRIEDGSEYQSVWELEPLPESVRLRYQADFYLEITSQESGASSPESDDELASYLEQPETFDRKAEVARREAAEWLTSIKRYAELRETRMRLWLRWLMDRYILRLRSDQRRIILALLAMQLITCLTFIAAVVGIGLASLLF